MLLFLLSEMIVLHRLSPAKVGYFRLWPFSNPNVGKPAFGGRGPPDLAKRSEPQADGVRAYGVSLGKIPSPFAPKSLRS
jgi:hypothetical protein